MAKETVIASAKKGTMAERMQKLVKPLSKIGQQKHLAAMRDGFALTLPLTIAGAIAILFITVVFGGWGAEKTSLLGLLAHASGNTIVNHGQLANASTSWELVGAFNEARAYGMQIFGWINAASLGSISIYVTLLVAFSMGLVRQDKSPILVAAVSLGVFFIFIGMDAGQFGAKGMLIGLISGLAASEFFMWIVRTKKMEIKLPPSVPPAVGRAFGILLPAIAVFLTAAMFNLMVNVPYMIMGHESLTGYKSDVTHGMRTFSFVVTDMIQQPFLNIAAQGGDIGILEIYLFGICFLFFFGIHGPNTLGGIFGPISILLWIDNVNGGSNVAMEQVWSGFILFGGNGGTLSLVILSMFLLKEGSAQKEVAKFALPAGIFEINEPVIFGFPIMFNFRYFFPYVFGPMIASIWPIIAIKADMMNAPTIMAPWTTPPILYGLIVTQFDWRSIVVSLLSFATLAALYLPFVLMQKKDDAKQVLAQQAEVVASTKAAKKAKVVKGAK